MILMFAVWIIIYGSIIILISLNSLRKDRNTQINKNLIPHKKCLTWFRGYLDTHVT